MCGIIGYTGKQNAIPLVIEGLKFLEYRGYDSFGIASLQNGKISMHKQAGKISNLSTQQFQLQTAQTAIGHTRWATHGEANEKNAHPHLSEDKTFAIVHNGIVENYQQIKQAMSSKGYNFKTETDTEAIVRLIEHKLKNADLKNAISQTFEEIEGRNAILLLDSKTKQIIAVQKGSPLTIGIGENEYFISSDATSLTCKINKAIFLADGEAAVINNNLEIFDITTKIQKQKNPETLNLNDSCAKKNEYAHFMLKEISEQKFTILQAASQPEQKIKEIAADINNAFGTYAVGCGTAGKVCLASTYFFSTIAKKHINFAFGSEFPNYHQFLKNKSLLLAVSQSGETADTIEAIQTMKKCKGKVISIINAPNSTISRLSDKTIPVNCGPEIAVCSTKSTTGQLAIMLLLAYACAGKYEEGKDLLKKTADLITEMMTEQFNKDIQKLAKQIKNWESAYIIGRAANYPIALEAAIKIQETSYLHAEGFAGGELKHGPIALISKGTPCIVLVANDEAKKQILSNAMEVKTRGGYIIGISPENNEIFDVHIKVPDVGIASPITNIIPIQYLAYHLAIEKGHDPDKPRNLAKSVTVK